MSTLEPVTVVKARLSDSLGNIELFPKNKNLVTKNIVLLGMLFISLLIVSNVASFKVAEIYLTSSYAITVPAALAFFPLTYFLDDVVTEVYGFKMSRFIIWCGLLCSAVFSFCIWLAITLPVSPIWDNSTHGANAFSLVLNGSIRIFFASAIAYFFGEFLNSMILAKLKIKTSGNYFFLRILGSTVIAAAVDSVIFCHIAFWNVLPLLVIWKIILTIYFVKVAYDFFLLPITFAVTSWLKKIDKVDYYDLHTKFNPFSLKLAD